MIAVLFGGAIALLPIYAQDILNVGSQGFGIMRAAPAVGALIIMFMSAYIPVTKNAGKNYWLLFSALEYQLLFSEFHQYFIYQYLLF